jgi:hypothetical protein
MPPQQSLELIPGNGPPTATPRMPFPPDAGHKPPESGQSGELPVIPYSKDSHVGVGWPGFKNLSANVPLTPQDSGVLFTHHLSTLKNKRPSLSRQGSRLAILVYQGSDPTQPYPTLVIRQSATLSLRLFASDTDDVVRPLVSIDAM